MSIPIAEKLSREHAALAAALPVRVVSGARRRAAIDELLARGLPTGRDENWRYANLRALERSSFAPAAPAAASDTAAWSTLLPAPVAGFTRLLVIDGILTSDAGAPSALPAGLELHSARASDSQPATGTPTATPTPADAAINADADERFALLNEAFALDEITLRTVAGVATVPALEFVFVSSGAGAVYPRLRLEVVPGTSLRLLERHVGGSAGALTNGVMAVRLAPDAQLDHYRLQSQGVEATWIDTLDVAVARGADYRLHQYAVGARSARSTLRIRLAEPTARVTLHAASIAEHTQVQDTYARIEHAAVQTRSVENFRAIATGRGRVAFNGHVVVRPGAAGSDSKQSLRSLIDGADAEVDARPQLEIYTDDVQCSHGATAGKLDETMLFYLLSRGLSRETAQSLLKWAFLEDTVAHIADAGLRATIEALLAAHLKDPTIAAGRRE